jgi:hypothetical protein
MPPYLTHLETWKAFWPLPIASLLFGLFILLAIRPRSDRAEFGILLLAFTMLGIVTGYLTGFSRQPAVGAVLPAALSFVGGLAVFLIGKESTNRTLVGACVFGFSLSLALGTGWGSVMRTYSEEYQRSEIYLKQQALSEVLIQEFRDSLGLPPLDLTRPENER